MSYGGYWNLRISGSCFHSLYVIKKEVVLRLASYIGRKRAVCLFVCHGVLSPVLAKPSCVRIASHKIKGLLERSDNIKLALQEAGNSSKIEG